MSSKKIDVCTVVVPCGISHRFGEVRWIEASLIKILLQVVKIKNSI